MQGAGNAYRIYLLRVGVIPMTYVASSVIMPDRTISGTAAEWNIKRAANAALFEYKSNLG